MSVKKHPSKGAGWWVVDCRPNGYMGKRVRRTVKGTKDEAKMVEQAMMGDTDDRIVYNVIRSLDVVDKDCSVVYFIRQGLTGPIKIGYSTNGIYKRLKGLQTGNSSILYPVGAIIGGTKETEKVLHDRFAHLKIKGEWFYPGRDLIEYISYVRLWPKLYSEPNP